MIYLRHFHLREEPFSITPDSDFFFPHNGVQAALNMLLVALRSGEGFLKIVGEVGCGKTVLCRQLLKILHIDDCVTAYIPNPDMGPDDLLMALVHELNVDVSQHVVGHKLTRHNVLSALRDCLLVHAAAGRRVVVCIDEAQAIPTVTLESLRLLSNLETEKKKLLQLLLLGQPELYEKLSRPNVRQLLQRITFSEHLGPMPVHQVSIYLEHRLATAALSDSVDIHVFSARTAREIARLSGGVPRLINVLAHKCLMLAFGEDSHRVNLRHVRLAAADTEGIRVRKWRPWWWLWKGTWSDKPRASSKASDKNFKDIYPGESW